MTDNPIYPHTGGGQSTMRYLQCNACGKQVSTPFVPVPTDTPDRGIIIRAWIECPECMEKRHEAAGMANRGDWE
jgi:hypothetical protein